MRTELVSQEKNIVVVKASFTTEEVTKAVNKTFKKLSNKSNIKGFRKGHVPAKTIELYFGKKAIFAETLEDVISNAIDEIIKEYELKIITDPDLNPSEIEENQPYEFTVTFEVSPEVILPKLETIEAEKIIYTPTQQMLNDNVVRLLEAHSEVVPTYEEREVKKDDYVSVKYTSNIVDSDGTIKEMEKDQKI
ncbi:MAG: trigger factor family protein, partial [Synergistaceae bacterium]|nr:trigger factor family protein [Synergistaceae bacterium]